MRIVNSKDDIDILLRRDYESWYNYLLEKVAQNSTVIIFEDGDNVRNLEFLGVDRLKQGVLSISILNCRKLSYEAELFYEIESQLKNLRFLIVIPQKSIDYDMQFFLEAYIIP